jgi:glycine oxidase
VKLICDTLIIGGGVVGLTTAFRLAECGLSVIVLDRNSIGREASWAGAGMLPPAGVCSDSLPAEARLRSYSCSLWDGFSRELRERTGIDNGYRVCGGLQLTTADLQYVVRERVRQWSLEGIRVTPLTRSEVAEMVPGLSDTFSDVWFMPEFSQVRNPRHLQALRAACENLNVRFLENAESAHFKTANQQIIEVTTRTARISAAEICISAGAWSGGLLESFGITVPVIPVRGQIVQLRMDELPFRCVLELDKRYLVPREDGLILVGSTEEYAGFRKQNTPEVVSDLLHFAEQMVPDLSSAEVVRTWSGLRPCSPDELPLIGRSTSIRNLVIGTGHFRSGLQMSPGTAAILADLIRGQMPAISVDGLAPDRFSVV